MTFGRRRSLLVARCTKHKVEMIGKVVPLEALLRLG
jgi:hypothetical protein